MWKHLSRANCLPFALISFQLRRLEMVAHHYCRSLFTVHDLSPTVSRRRLFICSFCLADKCCTQSSKRFFLKKQKQSQYPIFFPEKKKTIIINRKYNYGVCFWRLFLEFLRSVCVSVCVYFAFVFGSSGWLRIAFHW